MIQKLITKLFAIAIAFICLFALLMAVTSCSAEKKALKKENAAIDLILSSKAKMARILPPILEIFPCLNDTIKSTDTIPVYVKGKTDTIPFGIPYAEYKIKGLDTTIRGVKILIDTLGNVKVKVPYSAPDTIKVPVPYPIVDRRLLKNCEDSLKAKDKLLQDALLKGAGLETELSDMSKWRIYFWILVGVIVVSIVGYFLFKRGFKF